MRFADRTGREWTVAFTCGTVVTLERELGLRALDFSEGFWPAWCDLRRSVDMIWAIVADQAQRRNVTMMEFLEALDEEALQRARDALLEEYIRFFRSPTKRELIGRLRTEMNRFATAVQESLAARLEAILTATHGGSSSTAPG